MSLSELYSKLSDIVQWIWNYPIPFATAGYVIVLVIAGGFVVFVILPVVGKGFVRIARFFWLFLEFAKDLIEIGWLFARKVFRRARPGRRH